jgi:hypothetical protein
MASQAGATRSHVTNHSKHSHMVGGGYQLLLRTGLNSWYLPAIDHYEFTASAKLEFVRKYWLGLLARKIDSLWSFCGS